MVINKDANIKAGVLNKTYENFKGLKTPMVTAIQQCPDKHILIQAMLRENGINANVEPRDEKTFKVYTLKGERVLSYLDAFFNGKKVIKYIRRQENGAS